MATCYEYVSACRCYAHFLQWFQKNYLIIFFGAGIVGGILYYLTYVLGMIPPIPALGASGGIYGLLGAVAMLLPDMVIYVWFVPMRMKHAAILWAVLEFLGTFDVSGGIASAAHLGGLFFGLAYAYYLKNKQPEIQYPWWQQ
ncbi:rhomboid family intramembrane serine protease [Candidatus Micrarchaeota archaeon]|nr:rhomboid family intramembrane serine protease [Candidatus Micrarchaeota archaeon]